MKRTFMAWILMSGVVLGVGNPSAWAKGVEPGQSLEKRDASAWDYESFLDPGRLPLEEDL